MPLDGKKHGGHRNRMRERFIKEGLDNFEEHNILEMLLFYAIPQRDTNELAHSILDRFGSLEAVFDAPVEELVRVDGVGEHTAMFLHMFSTLTDVYIEDRKQYEIISTTGGIIDFIIKKLAVMQSECLMIVFIDNKNAMISWNILQEGYVSLERLDKRNIVRMIMGTNTTHIMLARSCARGKAKISRTDRSIALDISLLLRSIGVGLYDYIVVGNDRSFLPLIGNYDVEI